MRTANRFICGALLVVALGHSAHAVPYESFIDVDDEGDLQDLLSAGDITQDTYDELLDLLSQGVDLTTADRNELYTLPNLTYEDVDAIIAYRTLQRGRINDPAELVAAGALSQEKLLAISAFIITRAPGENPLAAKGWVRVWTRMSYHDVNTDREGFLLPPTALRARVTAMQHLTAGIAISNTRLDPGDPIYDPNRGALIAAPMSNHVRVPKAYVKWETDHLAAVAGTYRIGFGQRLVFDNSLHYSPNGVYIDDQILYGADLTTACKESAGELLSSPCLGAAGSEYVTPDFVWRDGLEGAAVGAKHIELSQGWLQLWGWASLHRRGIYQYELVSHGVPGAATKSCPDPHADSDPACTAPVVYVEPEGDLLTPTTRHSFQTLPNMFQERLVGANAGYFADRRNSVGLTFYTANESNLVKGVDLDVQEWSRLPYGGPFGALGASFSYGHDWLDLFGEAALSFDSINIDDKTATAARGGGGPAGLLRMTATRKKEELELVARYYSTDYANPYSRPISQPDEFEGQRARDETGVRARYIRATKELTIRALLDVWTNPSTFTRSQDTVSTADDKVPVKLDTYVRTMMRTTDVLWLGIWERYQDKDLREGGHDQCFEVSTATDENGEPIPCNGRQLTTIGRMQYVPNKQYQAIVQLEHQLLDDNTQMELKTKFRQDIAAWFIGYYRPNPGTRIRVRVRYLDEAINDNTYLERSIAALGEYSVHVREKDLLRVRIDSKFWLDKRASTLDRVPNPEATLWLFYQAQL